jgi:hypothetical protein
MSKHTVAAGDIGGIGQRAVQNNGELAGERHLGLAHASASGQEHFPTLQGRTPSPAG